MGKRILQCAARPEQLTASLRRFPERGASTSGKELSEAQAQQLSAAANDIARKSAVGLLNFVLLGTGKRSATSRK
jgi:hypothetical protein